MPLTDTSALDTISRRRYNSNAMSNEALLIGLVAGYGAGSLATYALIRFGLALQEKRRARYTPLAFTHAAPTPRVAQEIPRIVSDEDEALPPEHYTFPLVGADGAITRETISARYLLRFVLMPDISRAHWRGDRWVYGQILRVAEAHGWIERVNGRRVTWARDYRTLGRRIMRLRDYGITLPHPDDA